MSTPPFIPSGPLPSFGFMGDADPELWGARPSRALVVTSRDDELPDALDPAPAPLFEDTPARFPGAGLLPVADVAGSPSQRDAATSARDGRAPRTSDSAPND
jgi:hypothetical protein